MLANSLSLLALAGAAQAHMSMFYPPPLGGAPSINKQSTKIDKEFNYPLGCCGGGGPTNPSPGICRGHLDKFDKEQATVTWTSGQDAHFQLTDYSYDPGAPGSTHSGGSCQVGFSVDKGKTWKLAASYHGACPKHTEDGSPEAQTFDFKVPTGMPSGDALFAWTWLNREHEAFQNCAKVKIVGGTGSSPTEPTKPGQSGTQPKPSSPAGTPKPANSPVAAPPVAAPPVAAPPAGTKPSPKPVGTQPQTPAKSAASKPKPTTPVPGNGASDGESGSDSDGDSSDDESDDEVEGTTPALRPHREVKPNARRYTVDGLSCECRREPHNSRCYCDADDTSAEKRAAVEKKELRMHRRTLYKRVDACDWATAPAMEVSYYTVDAKCAPNAKKNVPTSDTFELSWDVKCGVVQGDGQYKLKPFSCGMYGGGK